MRSRARPPGRRQAATAGVVDCALSALGGFSDLSKQENVDAVEMALSVLSSVCQCAEVQVRAGRAGAVERVLEALRALLAARANTALAIEEALRAIAILTQGGGATQARGSEPGVVG